MSQPDDMAKALSQLAEVIAPVVEATKGYKASCMALGFQEEVAERMAADYHRVLMGMVSKSMGLT